MPLLYDNIPDDQSFSYFDLPKCIQEAVDDEMFLKRDEIKNYRPTNATQTHPLDMGFHTLRFEKIQVYNPQLNQMVWKWCKVDMFDALVHE